MILTARRAVFASVCVLTLLQISADRLHAQTVDAGACRQGVLALIVMIEAEDHDNTHYRNTAASVVATCGPPAPAAQPAKGPVRFNKAACAKFAMAMLETIETTMAKRDDFVVPRDQFAGQCMGN